MTWIGHSFGGQVLPFVRHDLLDSAILVATGNGHYHHNPPWLRRRAPLLWRGIVPLTTAVAGYFPGRRLGILGDLPSGVARQWGRWCMHPDYWGADVRDIAARHAHITHPVTLISVSDDPLVTRTRTRRTGATHSAKRPCPSSSCRPNSWASIRSDTTAFSAMSWHMPGSRCSHRSCP